MKDERRGYDVVTMRDDEVSTIVATRLSREDVIEKVRERFTRPGARLGVTYEEGIGDHCVYRGDSDPASPLRCPLGCLIPDDLYWPSFEGVPASRLLREHGEIAALFEPDARGLLADLQTAHDGADTVAYFLTRLDEIEQENGMRPA